MLQNDNIEHNRAEIQKAALGALRTLDGSAKSAVQMLTGASGAELDELGGFGT